MKIARIDALGAVIAVGALASVPLLAGSNYLVVVLTVGLCNAIWAASWDFMSGLTGRENFGHALFIGTGAYAAGFLNTSLGLNPWWGLPAAALVAVVFSLIIGLPTLRLSGDYLAIVTLGFGEIIRLLADNLSDITNGPRGLNRVAFPRLGESEKLPERRTRVRARLACFRSRRTARHRPSKAC